MTNIWVGDSRSRSLQYLTTRNATSAASGYIVDDRATFTWFESSGLQQLNQLSLVNSNIIIMLGFLDCIESCLWSDLSVEETAKSYAESINSAIAIPSSNIWYVCSVCPVDGTFSSAFTNCGQFSVKELNEKIAAFNTQLKQSCDAIFIDSYSYLNETGFTTYDGVRYTMGTAMALQKFITSHVGGGIKSNIAPRLVQPTQEVTGADSPLFWLSSVSDAEGYNPFEPSSNGKYTGDVLPNNCAYAWGRLYEIIASEPTLDATLTADKWFDSGHNYPTGQNPRIGAIMCWDGGSDDSGFVAVVEQVNPDGGIITSESISNGTYWQLTTRYEDDDGNWGQDPSYKFQGFIYCPNVLADGSAVTAVTKTQVTSSNKSLGTGLIDENYNNVSGISDNMKVNAMYIWQYLGSRGWTLNAVAALLGNVQVESTINPGRWQGGRVGGPEDGHGYGLVQWTPYTKYKNWCTENSYDMADIDSALKRIEAEVEASETAGWSDLDQWITSDLYNISFKDFTISTKDTAWLAAAFLINYERPKNQSIENQKARGRNATYWYNYLLPHAPGLSAWSGITGLKVDTISATEVTASFITNSSGAYVYTVTSDSGEETTGAVVDSVLDSANSVRVISFIVKSLVPNTKYTLTITATDDQDKSPIGIIEFKTLQDYPSAVEKVHVYTTEKYAMPKAKFKLDVTPSKVDFGYWGRANADRGYVLQLIVNGQLKKEKTVDYLPATFKLKDTFGYNAKVGDSIQIGVRSWVTYNGKKLYDGDFATCSNTVCLLTKHVFAYINRQ